MCFSRGNNYFSEISLSFVEKLVLIDDTDATDGSDNGNQRYYRYRQIDQYSMNYFVLIEAWNPE